LQYSAAIDLSGQEAGFAVTELDSAKLVINATRPMSGRTSAGLTNWALDLLKSTNINLDKVKQWTVGSGPGSFTGMRLAAGLVSGITYGKNNIQTRCVPTAIAIAATISKNNNENIAVLFDGRNHEILVYGVNFRNGQLQPNNNTAILTAASAEKYFRENDYTRFAALVADREAIEKVTPAAIAAQTVYIEHVPTEKLLAEAYRKFDNDLTDLVYIRPAVHTDSHAAGKS